MSKRFEKYREMIISQFSMFDIFALFKTSTFFIQAKVPKIGCYSVVIPSKHTFFALIASRKF